MPIRFCRNVKLANIVWASILVILYASAQLSAQDSTAKINVQTNGVSPAVHALQSKGIENFFQLSDRIYSGSAPEGAKAFAELQKLGIKTIITVDGAKPDVETARKYGIRYVHLPFGYDRVPTNQAIRLVKAAEIMPGPIYVHCHHGLHRGPAGAAVICMATEGWTATQAEAWLKLAGTATNYSGLYKSVVQFQPPSSEVLKSVPVNLPETSEVSPLAETMIQIDERFDNLKLLKKIGYQPVASHPDIEPAHEALLLNELVKELFRTPIPAKRGADFQAKLKEMEEASHALHLVLNDRPLDTTKAEAAFQRINNSCASCHKAHRN
ncbi:MAG: hypothetical protein JWQ71_2445 [Pedosphaera sp.]|nr:hypothetical protein [Pedosphaera sp.]